MNVLLMLDFKATNKQPILQFYVYCYIHVHKHELVFLWFILFLVQVRPGEIGSIITAIARETSSVFLMC